LLSYYQMSRIPVSYGMLDLCFVMIGTNAVALAASFIPALKAARVEAVETLRYE